MDTKNPNCKGGKEDNNGEWELFKIQCKTMDNLLEKMGNILPWELLTKEMEEGEKLLEVIPWNKNLVDLGKKVESLRKRIDLRSNILLEWKTLRELLEEQVGNMNFQTWSEDWVPEIDKLRNKLLNFLQELRFSGDDSRDCFLEVHSGAGGTDAQDWADMLKRMYIAWCEKRRFQYEIMELNQGKDCGIKNVLLKITGGDYPYGRLKNEQGIHRLVRLSPFNANNKRQTSFASVNVIPMVEESSNIIINPSDLIIDTYRSSGAGGQHVNTTDSAVRITHKPTGIVAQSQKERSQHSNKETAMKLLRSRLLQREIDSREKKKQETNNSRKSIDFGSQTRSYVLHPYKLVKDYNFSRETTLVEEVLGGNLDLLFNNET